MRTGSGLERLLAPAATMSRALLAQREPLSRFEPERFRDFVWRAMFAKTLPTEDFDAVTAPDFRVARVPWSAMHAGGLLTRKLGHPVYPRLDTAGFDVMIAETPYPGRVRAPTKLVVRYHDAIPLLMPHTISDKAYHQASHYHALQRNVRDGAWFVCVSEATRRDLLSIFPQAEPRTVTIHNMVSHHYYPQESSPRRIGEILRLRAHPKLPAPPAAAGLPPRLTPDYLVMVSTIEPRKNHLTLLDAWEQLRAERFPDLDLVIVGMLGWDHEAIVQKFRPWLERGNLHVLEDVPAPELRLLYRHARATVCPSFGEGFDFSGVEAMRSGGAVVASDIAVHRDIYRDAA
ncbi:glycosyl transferase group 1, partial [sediment metagenome]